MADAVQDLRVRTMSEEELTTEYITYCLECHHTTYSDQPIEQCEHCQAKFLALRKPEEKERMPLYVYKCPKCGEKVEVRHDVLEDVEVTCGECKDKMVIVVQPVVHFWQGTDPNG